MKKLATVATLVACIASPSVADVTDWTGAYAGVFASSNSGPLNILFNDAFINAWDYEGEQYGLFAGYNFGVDGYIVGVEAAYGVGDIHNAIPAFTAYRVNPIIDVKARAGKGFGNTFVYAIAGVSSGTYFEAALEEVSLSGTVYGAGIEMMVSEHVVLGFEALQHELAGDFSATGVYSGYSVAPSFTTLQARAAYKF